MTASETPLIDLLTTMTEASFEACELDPEALILARIAALVATDAPPISYYMNLGNAKDFDVAPERIRGVLAAVAPLVGTARVVSAMANIDKAYEIGLEVEKEL
jgi:alkylhydroperoxidase/carboxymuconolactone decarboxylase family protein YurZ